MTGRCLLCCLLLSAPGLAREAEQQEQADRTERCQQLLQLDEQELATLQFEDAPEFLDTLTRGERYRLGSVTTVRQNIFEEEDNWLQRIANRYHLRTRETVVLSLLPVESGDPVDVRTLAEAERLLRGKVYLYDARVIPERLCGDELDVVVVTRDVWTLDPQLNFSRSGGENEVSFGLSDSNLLGTGKALGIGYQRDKDRRGISVGFSDPNIGDSRWTLDVAVIDNDDGERLAAAVSYPFYSLDSRRAMFVSTERFTREESLYFLGDEIWDYRAETHRARVAGGWSAGLRGDVVTRYLVGYGFEDYAFDFTAEFLTAFPDSALPDRAFGYPFIAVERIQDAFDKRVNLDRVGRTEDLALGRRLYAELGYSTEALGGSDSGLLWRVEYDDAIEITENQLATYGASVSGYYSIDDDAAENVRADVQVAYRYRHSGDWSLLVRGIATAARKQTLDRQLLAGGAFGLRGFPNRFQTGDRRFLLTVEERYYSNIYPFRMFRLGGAVFVDVGRAWYAGPTPEWLPEDRDGQEFGILSNAGIGLRLESTRTRGDRVLHLDLAFPLQRGPGVGVEVTLSAKQTL